jgi:High potential iron-sulfur protein
MESKISRRTLLHTVLASPALGLLAAGALAADLTPLDPTDPTAKSLGFVLDSSKVDAAANPTHKPEQRCGTCAQFQGKAGDKTGGCNIFAGHSVPAAGWCKVWAQKPA